MMHYFKILYFCALSWFFCHTVQAIVIGSNTAPSRQGAASFPSTDSDNEMRGFAIFESGITLANSSTSVKYNSFYPVSGNIALNNGTLVLQRDMPLGSKAVFTTGGTITGNGYSIELPSIVGTFLISGALILSNVELILHSDVQLAASVTFNGDCTIIGNGHKLNLGSGSCIVGVGAFLRLQNINIVNIGTGNLSCSSATSQIELDGVKWLQKSDLTFSQGSLSIVGDCHMYGGYSFIYSTAQISTIGTKGLWHFHYGTTFAYQPSSGVQTLIAMEGVKSTLHFIEATLQVGSGGLQLTKGTVFCEGTCTFASSGISAANGIILGDGSNASNDVTLICDASSGPYVTSGYFVNKNVECG